MHAWPAVPAPSVGAEERTWFPFVEAEKASHAVTMLCRAVDASRAGYDAWRERAESEHAKHDAQRCVLVHAARVGSRRSYGTPRIFADLVEGGECVSRKRVARWMREHGLTTRQRKRYRRHIVSVHEQPIAANALARDFDAANPNQRWVGDTTELSTPGGRLFLSALLDLHSRLVVGWATSAVNDRHLVMRALRTALQGRRPRGELLHHSDHGSPMQVSDDQRRRHSALGNVSPGRVERMSAEQAAASWANCLLSPGELARR
jgi:putative transposase